MKVQSAVFVAGTVVSDPCPTKAGWGPGGSQQDPAPSPRGGGGAGGLTPLSQQ